MHRHRKLTDVVRGDIRLDQPAQRSVVEDAARPAPHHRRQPAHVRPPARHQQPRRTAIRPPTGELARPPDVRLRGEEGGVQRAGRATVQDIRNDSGLEQAQHRAGLVGAHGTARTEHEVRTRGHEVLLSRNGTTILPQKRRLSGWKPNIRRAYVGVMTDRDDDLDGEDDGVLDPSDSLESDDLLSDPLDTGIDAGDRYRGATRFGTTQDEEARGESLDELLAEEEPDDSDNDDEWTDEDEPRDDDRTAQPRAGRLLGEDEGAHGNDDRDLVAFDVGIDGGAASAEEAAIHLTDDPPFD